MIIMRLQGGLGNIMFQYALGRHLALRNKTDLKFDVDSFLTNPLGDYSFALEGFNIDIRNNLATRAEIRKSKIFKWKRGKVWFLYNRLIANGKKYVQEKQFHFDPTILDTKDKTYIHGWWQTEKYFADIRKILLKDFGLRVPLSGSNSQIAEHMGGVQAVSVHIRRLDYVTNPHTRNYHGELAREYYDRALAHIQTKVKNPVLFIFSDDIPWVRENMPFPFETVYVEGNMGIPHEDVHLMSLCKHHVIANSTLGWWGAWLNPKEDKIVVAPKVWFANAKKNNTKDIIPETWLRM